MSDIAQRWMVRKEAEEESRLGESHLETAPLKGPQRQCCFGPQRAVVTTQLIGREPQKEAPDDVRSAVDHS
jgi:hypothetical protein